MHIKTANGKKKVVISRKEWLAIGKRAQWLPDPADPERMDEINDEQFEADKKRLSRREEERAKVQRECKDVDWEGRYSKADAIIKTRKYDMSCDELRDIVAKAVGLYGSVIKSDVRRTYGIDSLRTPKTSVEDPQSTPFGDNHSIYLGVDLGTCWKRAGEEIGKVLKSNGLHSITMALMPPATEFYISTGVIPHRR